MKRKDLKDMTGQRFGARTAIAYAGNKKWHVRCDCGKTFVTDGADLRRRIYICNHTEEIRFFLKVNKTDKCWLWIGSRHKDGYGTFRTSNEPLLLIDGLGSM